MNDLRRKYIDSLDKIQSSKYLITISSQKSNYPIETFKKEIRLLNKRLNQRLIHKRRYKKSPNRVTFYCFFESSNNKNLTHVHIVLDIPDHFRDRPCSTRLDRFKKQTFSIVPIVTIMTKYIPETYSIDCRERHYSVEYSTKHYSDYNDNFDVF